MEVGGERQPKRRGLKSRFRGTGDGERSGARDVDPGMMFMENGKH